MKGKSHMLFLTISGTRDAPQAELEMQSRRKKLDEEINEEIEVRNEELIVAPFVSSETEEKKIQQAISHLEKVKAESVKVKNSAKRLAGAGTPSKEGIEHLGDMISNYGKRFGRQELGTEVTAATPGDEQKRKCRYPAGRPSCPIWHPRLTSPHRLWNIAYSYRRKNNMLEPKDFNQNIAVLLLEDRSMVEKNEGAGACIPSRFYSGSCQKDTSTLIVRL
jgi:hypothetical protein